MSQSNVVAVGPAVGLSQVKSIAQLVDHPEARAKVAEVAAKVVTPERMLRLMAGACRDNPALGEASPVSLLGSLMTLASLGLEPNTPLGHAYLIPFRKSRKVGSEWVSETAAQVVIGYRGMIELARRSGQVVSMHADVVYEGDEWEFWHGSGSTLRHRPMGLSDRPIWAYAYARLTDGGEAFDALPIARIERIRDGSEGWKRYQAEKAKGSSPKLSPWETHFHEMAAKTMIRRLFKLLPQSVETVRAQVVDEARVDYAAVATSRGAVALIDDGRALEVDAEPADAAPPKVKPSRAETAPVAMIDGASKVVPTTPALEDEIVQALADARSVGDVDTVEALFHEALAAAPDADACRAAIAVRRTELAPSSHMPPSDLPPHDPETGELLDDATVAEDTALPFDAPAEAKPADPAAALLKAVSKVYNEGRLSEISVGTALATLRKSDPAAGQRVLDAIAARRAELRAGKVTG